MALTSAAEGEALPPSWAWRRKTKRRRREEYVGVIHDTHVYIYILTRRRSLYIGIYDATGDEMRGGKRLGVAAEVPGPAHDTHSDIYLHFPTLRTMSDLQTSP